MPKGTRVHRCVEKLKGRPGINPYAVCQDATNQSYATGKSLGAKARTGKTRRYKRRLQAGRP